MKLRRIICLLLVFVTLAFTLASCNLEGFIAKLQGKTPQETTTTTTTEPTTVPTTTPTTSSKPDESTSSTQKPDDNDPPIDEWEDLYDIITIPEALEIAKATSSANPTERYYVRGTIVSISNPTYGEMTITDGVNELFVYGTYSEDGSIPYPQFNDKPVKGDEVLLYCTLNTHNGEPQAKNARLIDFKKADKSDINLSEYTEMTVLQAREAEIGEKILICGVVARITYATGMKPSGVYVIDGTDSIYIYDGDIASQVQIGNKITVLGSKAYWILGDEQNNAAKFGYKGCCQLEDALLYNNDNETHEIDFSWCETKTVKEINNIPVTENVTTTTYKTTALVKKVPGNGFVNYYFYDLDGKTGAYTYTQCNGSDFTWLDKFDGKICTVYLSPMNAKSTSSDCYFRFLPIAVIDEGFVFDTANAPEHILEYYAVDQFLSSYTGNPMLEVVTTVSSELLGFENAVISYSSSNESVVYFSEEDGKTIFNCGANGNATVTITATYGEYTSSRTVDITVDAPVTSEGMTVKEAIDSAVGEQITVVGIIGPSLVNQSGFYLIDETGAIAVRIVASDFEGLAIGQKIVVQGTRTVTKDGGGQICIDNTTIVTNYYGKVDYSTDSFIKNATMADVLALTDSALVTTNVYVVSGKLTKITSAYSVNYYIDGFLLYSGGKTQYAWLDTFFEEGTTEANVTVELAICDWNAKGLKGCVLAVITEDGKICNELNFN